MRKIVIVLIGLFLTLPVISFAEDALNQPAVENPPIGDAIGDEGTEKEKAGNVGDVVFGETASKIMNVIGKIMIIPNLLSGNLFSTHSGVVEMQRLIKEDGGGSDVDASLSGTPIESITPQ